jgi:sirohydrochlorin ferrochelatase
VIVDHGSRRKASNDMLLEFCQLYQQITQHRIVEPAHMEIAEPSIAQAIGAGWWQGGSCLRWCSGA